MMKKYRFLRALKVAFIAILATAVLGSVTMILWNALMPGIFAVHAISFWQAVGLLILSKLLFGGFRGFSGGSPRWRRRVIERWEQMTPEEKEKFREGMRRGCGPFRGAGMTARDAEVKA